MYIRAKFTDDAAKFPKGHRRSVRPTGWQLSSSMPCATSSMLVNFAYSSRWLGGYMTFSC